MWFLIRKCILESIKIRPHRMMRVYLSEEGKTEKLLYCFLESYEKIINGEDRRFLLILKKCKKWVNCVVFIVWVYMTFLFGGFCWLLLKNKGWTMGFNEFLVKCQNSVFSVVLKKGDLMLKNGVFWWFCLKMAIHIGYAKKTSILKYFLP